MVDAPHRLLLLGSGPDRDRLLGIADRLGLSDRLTVRESVPSTDVAGILASMSMLVLPSRTTPTWKEQFGRVLVEAMAAGVPVIGSSSGAIPEVIGDAGDVVPEGDAGELASRITRLLTDPAHLAARRASGKVRAGHFSADQFARRAAEFLRELV